MTPLETPRTDAEIGRVHLSEGRNMVTADFARELELLLRRAYPILLGSIEDRKRFRHEIAAAIAVRAKGQR